MDDAFVVNIGDMLEIWSNGAFTSTTHRVRKVAEERYSFPLFFNVDYDVLVSPLEQFVRSDGTNKVSLRAGEHLYAQTIHAFGYLRRRLEAGEISMPDGSLDRNSFGREAIKNREAQERPTRPWQQLSPVPPSDPRRVHRGLGPRLDFLDGSAPFEDTLVWWLQSSAAHADLRVPFAPDGEVISFAGETVWADPSLTWIPALELVPTSFPTPGSSRGTAPICSRPASPVRCRMSNAGSGFRIPLVRCRRSAVRAGGWCERDRSL